MSAPKRPTVAIDRAALILRLVPYLMNRGEVSVTEAAADFDVTEDEMREMAQKLSVIGLPGDGGFWQMPNDLFDIDWDLLESQDRIVLTNVVGLDRAPKFTAREAAALVAGLQLTAAIPGLGDDAVFSGLLGKLARGASGDPVTVVLAPTPPDEIRRGISDARARSVAVEFDYKAPDAAVTRRMVDPVRVHVADGQWYLQGWCHLRQAMRTFQVDRISNLQVTEVDATHADSAAPELFTPSDEDVVVEIRFPTTIAGLLGDYLTHAEVTLDGDLSRARIRVADERSLKRLATRRGGQVEILSPPSARRAAAEWAREALERYRAAPADPQ